jgi:hypothetical protein
VSKRSKCDYGQIGIACDFCVFEGVECFVATDKTNGEYTGCILPHSSKLKENPADDFGSRAEADEPEMDEDM